jgi:hypothetical protein
MLFKRKLALILESPGMLGRKIVLLLPAAFRSESIAVDQTPWKADWLVVQDCIDTVLITISSRG